MKAFYNNVGEQGEGGLDTVNLIPVDVEKKISPLQREIALIEDKLAKQKTSEAEVLAWTDRLVKRRLAWEPLAISKLSVPKGNPMIASDALGFELTPIKAGTQPVVASVKLRAGRRSPRCASSASRKRMRRAWSLAACRCSCRRCSRSF